MIELIGTIGIVVMLLLGTITQVLLKKNGNSNNKAKKLSFVFYIIAMVLGMSAVLLYFTERL